MTYALTVLPPIRHREIQLLCLLHVFGAQEGRALRNRYNRGRFWKLSYASFYFTMAKLRSEFGLVTATEFRGVGSDYEVLRLRFELTDDGKRALTLI